MKTEKSSETVKKQGSVTCRGGYRNRVIALILSVVLAVSLVPVMETATPVKADDVWEKTADTLLLGTNGIGNPSRRIGQNDAWKGSYVYFGAYDGRYGTNGAGNKVPVKYRVLWNDTTRFSEAAADGSKAHTLFLDCDNVLYKQAFDDNRTANPGATNPNEWYYSDIAGRVARDTGTHDNTTPGLNDEENGFIATGFTKAENVAIAYSTIASHALSTDDTVEVPVANWTKGAYINYVALNHEKLFLLDGEEASNPAYGYIKSDNNNTCRVKNYIPSENSGNAAFWWLRSAYDSEFEAGCVKSDGYLYDGDVESTGVGVSPAFNINLSSVIFSSLIKGTEAAWNAEYKLTIKDDDLNISVTTGAAVTIDDTTKVVTVPYTVTDTSDTSDPNRISVVITNGTWTANGWSDRADLLQYGELTVTDGNVTTGTGTFTLDTTKVNGTWGTNYHVYILAEHVNTDDTATTAIDESQYTDYASVPVEIQHAHSYTYAAGTGASANTITATCANGGCNLTENKVSFSIAAPQLNTYGGTESAAAGLSGADAFNSATGNDVKAADIKYTGINGTSYTESTTPPTNAGDYRASITVDTDKTAYVDYTIGKKAVTVTANAQTINEGGSIEQGTCYVTVSTGAQGLLNGHSVSAVTLTQDDAAKTIIPSAIVIKDADGNTVTDNYSVSYVNGTLNVNAAISATVTFKVVNGAWDDETDADKIKADKIVTLSGFEGDTLKLTAADIPAVGSKPDDTYKAGSWDSVPGTGKAFANGSTTTYTYTYAKKDSISATVTFKVVNGAWDDETDADKAKEDIVVTLTGYEGDTLKLAADQIPAVGSKPDDTYKAGSWDTTPSVETAITADTTYTYTYVKKDSKTAKVTFKVVNGAWDDGKTEDVIITLSGYEGDILKLSDGQIPAVGNKANDTYKVGSWDVTPSAETAITVDITYTYTYAKEEAQPTPEPSTDPEPETPSSYTNKYVYAYNVGDQPKNTNTNNTNNNGSTKTVNNPGGSVSKITTVKNADNSVTTITETTDKDGKLTKTTETVKKYPGGGVKTDTKTEYPDGTVKTEKKTEYSNGNIYYKSVLKDENGNTVTSTNESTVINSKGTKTFTSTTRNADGSNSKTYIRETAAGKKTEKQYIFDAEGNGTYSVTNSNKNGVTFSESFDITGTNAILTSFFTNKKKATVPKTILVAGIERLITEIAKGAFKGNTSITNVRVEAGITTIGSNAFAGAVNLKKLFLPATLTKIGKNAFTGIPKLTIYIKAEDKKTYEEAEKTLKRLLKKAGIAPDIIMIKREK